MAPPVCYPTSSLSPWLARLHHLQRYASNAAFSNAASPPTPAKTNASSASNFADVAYWENVGETAAFNLGIVVCVLIIVAFMVVVVRCGCTKGRRPRCCLFGTRCTALFQLLLMVATLACGAGVVAIASPEIATFASTLRSSAATALSNITRTRDGVDEMMLDERYGAANISAIGPLVCPVGKPFLEKLETALAGWADQGAQVQAALTSFHDELEALNLPTSIDEADKVRRQEETEGDRSGWGVLVHMCVRVCVCVCVCVCV
jgi:hypothetical protein